MKRFFLIELIAFLLIVNIYANDFGMDLTQDDISTEYQVKALDNIYFCDTKEIVSEKIMNNPNYEVVLKPFKIFEMADIKIPIGNNKYDFNVYFNFYENKLYRVELSSPKRMANYYDTDIINFRNKLVEIIQMQYGKSSWNRELSFSDIDSGYITWSHIWNAHDIGQKKEIKIGISEFDYEYTAKVYIDYLPLIDEKNLKEKALEEETTKNISTIF